MLKDGEKLKDNQRKEISIRNIKLSEGTSRNRCIHSRIDVRAMSVKGKLVRITMSHTSLKVVFKGIVVKSKCQSIEREYCIRF